MMTGYDFSRKIFNWSFENEDKSNPTLIAVYLFLVEVNNRLGWKSTFSITAKEVQTACCIKSYNTFKKNFDSLIEYGFVKIAVKSKNQYTANIIALSKFNKALDTALDKALMKHLIKQSESTCDIHKQVNNKQVNNKQYSENIVFLFDFFKDDFKEIWEKEFIPLKKKKKGSITERALISQLNKIKKLSNNSYLIALQILENSVNGGWTDFYELKEGSKKVTQKKVKSYTINPDIANDSDRMSFD